MNAHRMPLEYSGRGKKGESEPSAVSFRRHPADQPADGRGGEMERGKSWIRLYGQPRDLLHLRDCPHRHGLG